MAESVVSVLVEKLDVFLSRKWDLVVELDDKIQSLRIDLEFLQAFLKDVDERGRDNERAKVWISQVRSIAFRAEDAIDEYLYKVWFRSERGFIGSLKNFADHSSRLRIRHHLAVEIEGINNRLQQIKASKFDLGIDFNQSRRDHHVSSDEQNHHKSLPNSLDDIEVVGFVDDVKMLRERLVAENPRRTAICIVGMGGLGKTTLARKLYNSDIIKSHFQTRSWVSVSQRYNAKQLLQVILENFTKENNEDTRPDKIIEKLKDFLKVKRYLLVIDDIWDRAAWDDICTALPEGADGSRIIVTTRIEDVAKHIDPHGGFIHKPQCLTKGESWDLFCLRAFGSKGGCPDNLEDIGKRIVSECAGLPLAISVIGGLMSRKSKSVVEWTKVLDRITYELNEGEDGQAINRILMLSFDALPHYLRSCFLYFSLFPEDSEIDAEVLIQMWVAEGFVKNRGQQTMEEVGEDYLEELANRSMIQVVERDLIGKISKCRIHDLLLELSISQGKEEKFSGVLQVGGSQFQNDRSSAWCPRRLALHGSGSVEHIVPLVHSSSLGLVRCVLGFDQGKRRDVDYLNLQTLLIGKLRLLRVLNLKGFRNRELPKEIGQLVHLKLLGMEDAYLETLPSSLGMLLNLQTLRIGRCALLPGTLWKIESLRHIFVWLGGEVKERKVTLVTSCKANLQTLNGIRAGDWIGRCLHKFTNLRVLSITDIRENHVAMLVGGGLERLLHLTSLQLGFSLEEEGRPIVNVRHVLAKLENFPSLHHLGIYRSGYSSTQKGCSSWMCGLFGNRNLAQLQNEGEAPTPTPSPLLRFPTSLVRLLLRFPRGLFSDEEELLASLSCLYRLKILELGDDVYRGKELTFSHNYIFPKLEELELIRMRELEQYSIGGGGDAGVTIFPCLKRLRIYFCDNLKAVPEGLQHITTLQELRIRGCSNELEGRVKEGGGEDWDKIKHIPSVQINDHKIQVEQQQVAAGNFMSPSVIRGYKLSNNNGCLRPMLLRNPTW